ncbi:MAG: oligosaccharide flippase family protein [Nitrospirae bacterium]|nr:oligosaccharide flippase family protein [Nitrospirota bacterium]
MNSNKSSSKILSNAIANWGGYIINIAIAFFLSPFLVHTLGDTKYGIWSIVAALSGYMSLLEMGIGSALTRYVSKFQSSSDKENLLSSVNSALFLYAIIAGFILLLSPVTAAIVVRLVTVEENLKDIIKLLVIITSVNVSFLIISSTFRGIFQGLQRYDIINTTQVVIGICRAILFYLFLSQGYGLISMGIIALAGSFSLLFISYLFMRKKYSFIHFDLKKVSRFGLRSIFTYSAYTFINMIANQLTNYTGSFVIGYFMGAAAITYFSIAWSLTEYLKQFCMAFTRVFIPAISEYEAIGDYETIRKLYISGTKYTLIIVILFCLGIMMLGEPFIALWMGSKYSSSSAPVLIILIISQLFELPQLISYSVLFGLSKHKKLSYASLISAIVNFLLSIILVRKFGLIGVALGTAIPQIVLYGIFVPFYTNRNLKLSIRLFVRKTYMKVIIPAVLLLIILKACLTYIYPTSYFLLLSEALTCAAIFIGLSCIFSLDKQERNTLFNNISLLRVKMAGILK